MPLPLDPESEVGIPGTAAGTTACEALEGFPSPTLFVADTVNVYDVPLVRPSTSQLSGPLAHTHVSPPGFEVAVYCVMVAPLFAGAVHEIVASSSPRSAETEVGAPGTAAGTNPADITDVSPRPTAFTATILK